MRRSHLLWLLAVLPLVSCGLIWTHGTDSYTYTKEIVVAIDFDTDVTGTDDPAPGTLIDQSPRSLGNNAECLKAENAARYRCPTFVLAGGPNGSGAYEWEVDLFDDVFLIDDSESLDFSGVNEFSISFDAKTSDWGNATAFVTSKFGEWELKNLIGASPPHDQVAFSTVGEASFIATSGAEANNAWHHILLIWDGPNSLRSIYVDNALVSSSAITATVPNATTPIEIGQRLIFDFVGLLDNYRVYNYALGLATTPDTINDDYIAGDI